MTGFTAWDWGVVAAYAAALAVAGVRLNAGAASDAREYFQAGGRAPAWLAAVSVLATTQSAATFLGGPDYGYRGDFTYLAANLGALIAAFVVARVLMPRFYAEGAGTVYELLGRRFGQGAVRAAGLMFIVGRVLAGGARLYLAAIAAALAMIGRLDAASVLAAACVLMTASVVLAFYGGLRAILWIDLLQLVTYVGAALAMLALLVGKIHASAPQVWHGLAAAPGGVDKLRLFDLSLDPTRAFALPAILTGYVLLSIGSFGLDQDTTQRLLACRDARSGARGLYLSVLATTPVVALFVAIGSLLYVVYRRPDLMGGAVLDGGPPPGVTVFMHFILTQAPPGLRGLALAGILATALGTTMSALNAMSSVLVQDFYRPWRERRRAPPALHYVRAGRVGMAATGVATLAVAALSYFWQRYSDTPLLDFVLSVMTFAYAGLLGVYLTALFSRRGNLASVYAALAVGFATILVLQPYVADRLQLPDLLRRLAFPWQLCIGTTLAWATCLLGSPAAEHAVVRPPLRAP